VRAAIRDESPAFQAQLIRLFAETEGMLLGPPILGLFQANRLAQGIYTL